VLSPLRSASDLSRPAAGGELQDWAVDRQSEMRPRFLVPPMIDDTLESAYQRPGPNRLCVGTGGGP
jgi:hypothetical protein